MGSGDRIKLFYSHGFGLGFFISNFPFQLTVSFHFILWGISMGFGKGYDQK